MEEFLLIKEDSRYCFPGNPVTWAANYGPFASHQEEKFPRRDFKELQKAGVYGVPMLLRVGPSAYVALTEAELSDWAGMYLSGSRVDLGRQLFASSVMAGASEPKKVDVSVKGAKILRLITEGGRDVYSVDPADWADAKLIAADGTETYLSALEPVAYARKGGAIGRDKTIQGEPITLGERVFERGICTRSGSEVVYDLGGKYDRFEAVVGVDAAAKEWGGARFEIYG
jgi:hypothetical protein